jgi:hypothetical protein
MNLRVGVESEGQVIVDGVRTVLKEDGQLRRASRTTSQPDNKRISRGLVQRVELPVEQVNTVLARILESVSATKAREKGWIYLLALM